MAEKTQAEQNAAQRQGELLAEALEKARSQGGTFLNAAGKKAPGIYPKGQGVSAFNALTLALHSDRGGYKTNLYTVYSGAKRRGESVQSGEKGVPFIWYRWNEYRSKSDEGRTIPREEYEKLPDEQKKEYAPVRDRQVRTLFNIEQTTLPISDRETFAKVVKEQEGPGQDDKQIRIAVNRFLLAMDDNLVRIRKDGTGLARYDTAKDVIHLPAQKNYPAYSDYVQEAVRQVVAATGHPQRLGRKGASGETRTDRERLVVELASAVKMNQLGLPAKLSPESLELVDKWKASMHDNPRFLDGIEADVNNAASMIAKAERGEKIDLKEVREPVRSEGQTQVANVKMTMVQDDAGRWALYLKPESEAGFAVYPEKADVGRFFAMAKKGGEENDRFRQALAGKYINLAAEHPDLKADLFSTREKDIDLSAIRQVSIVRTKEKDENGKDITRILSAPVIQGMEKQEPREVSPAQWQRLWLTEDKTEYKRNLAATLFADVLRRQQEEQERKESPEQKAKEEQEEKRKEALTRTETSVVAGIVAGAAIKQEEEERGRGFHR